MTHHDHDGDEEHVENLKNVQAPYVIKLLLDQL